MHQGDLFSHETHMVPDMRRAKTFAGEAPPIRLRRLEMVLDVEVVEQPLLFELPAALRESSFAARFSAP